MAFPTDKDFDKYFDKSEEEEKKTPDAPFTNAKGVHPNNFGWIQAQLSDDWMAYLWERADASTGSWKYKLAGHIESSKKLIDVDNVFFEGVIKHLINAYHGSFGTDITNIAMSNSQVKAGHIMQNWWVNYQKAGDFQPTHNHSGLYSFVIWMKIPFTYQEQNEIPIAKESNAKRVSAFEFNYIDILGNCRDFTYELGPTAEGTIVFFPARLNHLVYPFYNCDEERVSISGNIGLDYTKGVPPVPDGYGDEQSEHFQLAHGYEKYFKSSEPDLGSRGREESWKKTTLPINNNSNTLPKQRVVVQELDKQEMNQVGQVSEMTPRNNEQDSFDDWKSLRNVKYAKMDDTFFT
tara:strand:+ start:2886 stop:3932 length:1047 start_codon:yes stop_codon:yes gene_type:complete